MKSSCLSSPSLVDSVTCLSFLETEELKPAQLFLMWKHFHIFDNLLRSFSDHYKKILYLGVGSRGEQTCTLLWCSCTIGSVLVI